MKEGWEIKRLGELCFIKGRIGYRGYTKQDLVSKGNGAISLSPGNISDSKLDFDNCTFISWPKYEESPEIQLRKGDIVYCKTASIGKLALVDELPEKATINPQFVVLKEILCSNRYLYHFLTSPHFREQVVGITGGTAIPTVSQANLADLIVPVPPLSEQHRIVEILDKAFADIAKAKANAERNLQNARALFESQLNDVFTKKGEGWVETTLDKISTNLDSKRIPITKTVRTSGEYPYYGASGIVDYVADYIFEGDNLLVSEDGANLLARSTPIAFSVSGKYWVNNHAHILHFENMATQRFAEFYLESIKLDDYVTGAAQPKLNQKALNSIPIPIPKSVDAQARIVDDVESLQEETQRLARIYERKHEELEALKKSILHKAFSGDLDGKHRHE